MCGSEVDTKHTHRGIIWKVSNLHTMFIFIDYVCGITLYQKVNVTGAWFDSVPKEVSGGSGVVEMFH